MQNDFIEIIGARTNNLKNINLKIPKKRITIFTGVSGSGKSSIVFETIAQEAGRQLNETFSNFVRTFLPKYERPDADAILNLPAAIVVDQNRLGGNSRSTLGTITDINSLLRLLFSRIGQPHIGLAWCFSFNEPQGMCKTCEGIGKIVTLDVDKALDRDKSLNEGAILLPGYTVGGWMWNMYGATGFFDPDKKIRDYSPEEYDRLVYGKAEKIQVQYMGGELNSTYESLVGRFMRQNTSARSEKSESSQKKIDKFITTGTCPDCGGSRYNETALSSKILGYNIADLTAMQLDELVSVIARVDGKETAPVVKSIIDRLNNLIDIGLGYMRLDRETTTLSGGESQRVKMVKHLTSSLADVVYIFDEPSIGLHPRDVHRLNELLMRIRDKGNTVLVVEHDPDVMRIADHIVDVGPQAGAAGGRIVYEGTFDGLKAADTLTGRYLGRSLEINDKPRKAVEFLETEKSSLHNLKDVSLRVPKGVFTVVTGVAGSGKSSLVNGVFAKKYPEAIIIDQSAVAANIRSNPATFTGVMDIIRQSFASEHNVSPGLFSYNSEGACPACGGKGFIETNLSFMDAVNTVCEECGGHRYRSEALEYKLRGKDGGYKNIKDVMAMTVAEASEFFEQKEIRVKLKSVIDVGLNYMTLGQPLTTLSGGECQRLKLARELTKKGNIYIMDEPTTGLHMSDITLILGIISKLAERGNTVVVVEHNLDVIRRADWIIDLGPDGGSGGGSILYEGPPAGICECKESATGRYI